MAPTTPAATSPLNRAQVHTAFGKFARHLRPAAAELSNKLLDSLDDSGSASVKALHERLFPMATTASASSQLSKLLTAMGSAAEAAKVLLTPVFDGSKQAGVAQRRLRFEGPRPGLVADTEGLNAIPQGQSIPDQRVMPVLTEKRVVLVTFNPHEFAAVAAAFTLGAEAAWITGDAAARELHVHVVDAQLGYRRIVVE